MAFIKARCTKYQNIRDKNGDDIAILIGGWLEDDRTTKVRMVEYLIEGEEFASLPLADPVYDGTPYDIRFQAIYGILLREASLAYAIWNRELTSLAITVEKPAEILAMLPPITTLLDIPVPELPGDKPTPPPEEPAAPIPTGFGTL